MLRKNNSEIKKAILSDVPNEYRFVCVNSEVLKNIEELLSSLKSMKKQVFSYHVNKEKNDFSTWIYDIIGAVDLADELRPVTDQKIMQKKLKAYIINAKKEAKK